MRFAPIAAVLIAVALPARAEIPCGAPGVTARVDPEIAVRGEVILVTVTNDSDSDITIPDSCIFDRVFSLPENEEILTLICLDFPNTIPSGESDSQAWDQRNNDGEQVPNGDYAFSVQTGSGFGDVCFPTVTIAPGVPALARGGLSTLVVVSALAGIGALRRRRARSA
jgi:hypothetical protein